jgi:melibiose permease/lactose/raffinose/galactose permease
MMPALSTDQKEREKIGSFARICANIGLFVTVVGIIPVTNALGEAGGSMKQGWFYFALIVAALMLGFQAITLIGVKEHKGYFKEEESTSLREMFRAIIKNDQLLWVAVSMSLFMIGYMITTNFGVHFFKYAYGDENMYSIFAAVLGVSQLSALMVFTLFSKRFSRRKLYTGATILVVAGYVLFFFSPMNMIFIGVAGVLIFVGQAFIQLLMLMFLADSIEYGQWKLGKRNESITFSIQPLINKLGGAIATGVLGITLIRSGINAAETAADVPEGGITLMKTSMLILPLILIVAGYIIYLLKFKIDEKRYAQIISDLHERGDITGSE